VSRKLEGTTDPLPGSQCSGSQHPPIAFRLRRTQGQYGETHTEEQIIAVLKEAEAAPVVEARPRHAAISKRRTCAVVVCALSSKRYRFLTPD